MQIKHVLQIIPNVEFRYKPINYISWEFNNRGIFNINNKIVHRPHLLIKCKYRNIV